MYSDIRFALTRPVRTCNLEAETPLPVAVDVYRGNCLVARADCNLQLAPAAISINPEVRGPSGIRLRYTGHVERKGHVYMVNHSGNTSLPCLACGTDSRAQSGYLYHPPHACE